MAVLTGLFQRGSSYYLLVVTDSLWCHLDHAPSLMWPKRFDMPLYQPFRPYF
jgi:hypothetical protein